MFGKEGLPESIDKNNPKVIASYFTNFNNLINKGVNIQGCQRVSITLEEFEQIIEEYNNSILQKMQ